MLGGCSTQWDSEVRATRWEKVQAVHVQHSSSLSRQSPPHGLCCTRSQLQFLLPPLALNAGVISSESMLHEPAGTFSAPKSCVKTPCLGEQQHS